MGLAYTNYVCVCREDANVRMPTRVLVGFLVQSRGVFAIGQNIESRGTFCMTFRDLVGDKTSKTSRHFDG